MKKLAILLLVMSSTLNFAQRPAKQSPNGGMYMYKDLSAEQIASLETKKLTLLLDLNTEQQAKVNRVNLKIAQNRIEARDKQKSGEKLSSEQRFAKMEAKLDQQIAVKNKFKEILNREQFARWEKQQLKRKKARKSPNSRVK